MECRIRSPSAGRSCGAAGGEGILRTSAAHHPSTPIEFFDVRVSVDLVAETAADFSTACGKEIESSSPMALNTVLIRTPLAIVLSASLAAAGMQNPPTPQNPPASQEKPAEKKPEEHKKKHDLPLKTDRTIEFETDEATWLSLDVTPDGQAIIFELAGDLYRVPIAGGAATRITDG